MALVNPNIAMSFKPTTEYQPRNVLADFANLQKIQSEQMEMAKLKREESTQNALANAYSQSVDPTTGAIDYNKLTGLLATGGGGKEIPTVQKARRELETAELTKQKTSFEVQKAQNEFIAQAQRDTSQNPSDANITAYKEDLIANPLFDDAQKQKLIAGADRLLAMPVDQRRLVMSSRGASASELKPTTQMINRGGRTDVVQIPAFGGAPVSVGTYADVPLPPDVAAQKEQIAAASRSPGTTIINTQEKAEAGEFGKFLVKDYENISSNANLAQRNLPVIDTNLNILNKGFETGFGTETKAAAAKVLSALGVEKANMFATNAQIFEAKAAETVLNKQLEQKGPQTESDAKRLEQTVAQLSKTPESNRFLLSAAKAQLNRDIEQRKFYNNWRKNTGSFDGAEEAWIAGEGGKSLFDRPELKKYSVGANAAAAQIPTVSAPVAAPAARAIPPAAVQMLLSGQGTDAQFDAMFGAGAAKRARGSR